MHLWTGTTVLLAVLFPPEPQQEEGEVIAWFVYFFAEPDLQDQECITPPPGLLDTVSPQDPWGPGSSSALTGHMELDCSLHSNTNCEAHLTGEIGAIVLGPWGDSEH